METVCSGHPGRNAVLLFRVDGCRSTTFR